MPEARRPPQLTLRQIQKVVIFVAVASACVAPGFQLVRLGAAELGTVLVMEGIAIPVVLAIATLFLVRPGPLRKWIIVVLVAISVGAEPGFVLGKWGVADWPAVPLIEGVTLPLALALAMSVLVRRWPLQEWVAPMLLAVCVGAALLMEIAIVLTLTGLANEKLRSLLLEEQSMSRHPGTSSPAWKSYFGLPVEISWLVVAATASLGLGLALIVLLIRIMPTECPRCQRHLLFRDSRSGTLPWPVHRCLSCGARFMKVPARWEPLPGP
jgi:hypothetical protein